MKINSVKGTRDLYPDVMAPLRRIFDTWHKVSERHGFLEYEGPTLEMLDLYREKSGDELVGQLYRLTDSGGRELALRPEMTPTLARMVAARVNTLPKPIKWFCIPRLFRGENVQRGRLREFFQWNVDVIGTADVIADAECILVGVEALRELGLRAEDFVVHISNRRLIAAILSASGIAEPQHNGAYALLDKAGKMSRDDLSVAWGKAYGEQIPFAKLDELLGANNLDALRGAVASLGGSSEALDAALAETEQLFSYIDSFGIREFCNLNLHIVRGLAYYTGPVFEFYDRSAKERAICGGGRYDDLLGKLGKSQEPAVGFGMGDVVLSLLLEEKGLLHGDMSEQAVWIVSTIEEAEKAMYTLVAALRRQGVRAEFSYTRQAIGKQLKAADKKGVSKVVILGDETLNQGRVQLKDMSRGRTWDAPLDTLMKDAKRVFDTGAPSD